MSVSSRVIGCTPVLFDTMTVKERARTTRGHVITPWGGVMLGKFQQNSRILILCIYFLSNIFIVKIFRIFKIGCKGQ